jgi:ferredoxin-NADP reductase
MERTMTRYQEQTLQLVVGNVTQEADGVVSLGLGSAEGQQLPPWEAGAHLEVVLGDDLVRHYSLCGETSDDRSWRIAVLREPNSRGGSQLIHETVRPGHTLTVKGPRNNFRLVDSERHLFIAGGIGITPILPMVRHAASTGTPWTLLYGGRTRGSMAFLDELGSVPGGELLVRPQDEFGLLDLDTLLGEPQPGTSVYCCGPGPLIDAVEERCRRWPAGSLHRERFAQSTRTSSEDPFEVELARSGRRITVPSFTSMLDVLEEAGYEVTNSCRAGICGTCLTDVVSGEPEHNDDVLTDEERASNKVMLPCVSRSKTDVLVIDL